jgi:Protein of unknown function (DUF3574)
VSLRLFVPAFLCALASLGAGCLALSTGGVQTIPFSTHEDGRPLTPRRVERPDADGSPGDVHIQQERKDGVGRLVLKGLAATGNVLMAAPAYAVQQLDSNDRPIARRRAPAGHRRAGLAFARTELFFGTAKREGAVTPDEFNKFLEEVVTPLFPDGLTVTKVDGQFKGEDGVTIKEDAYVLVLMYPADGLKASGANIDLIRRIYMRQHQQESVLRADDPYLLWVSF